MGSFDIKRRNSNSGILSLRLKNNGTNTNVMTLSDNKVGIGTSSPTQKLHVTGDVVIDKTNNGYSGLRIHDDSGDDYNSYIDLGRNQSGTRLTIRYSGRVQGTTPWTNATASPICSFARGGIAFGSDTASANTLDDYEEGTWTPTITGSTTNPAINYTNQYGTYVKIGRLVYVTYYLNVSAVTAQGSGFARLSSFPFTIGSGSGIGEVPLLMAQCQPINDIGNNHQFGRGADGTDYAMFGYYSTGQSVALLSNAASNIGGGYLIGSFTYQV
jgi:hypothetical protein